MSVRGNIEQLVEHTTTPYYTSAPNKSSELLKRFTASYIETQTLLNVLLTLSWSSRSPELSLLD